MLNSAKGREKSSRRRRTHAVSDPALYLGRQLTPELAATVRGAHSERLQGPWLPRSLRNEVADRVRTTQPAEQSIGDACRLLAQALFPAPNPAAVAGPPTPVFDLTSLVGSLRTQGSERRLALPGTPRLFALRHEGQWVLVEALDNVPTDGMHFGLGRMDQRLARMQLLGLSVEPPDGSNDPGKPRFGRLVEQPTPVEEIRRAAKPTTTHPFTRSDYRANPGPGQGRGERSPLGNAGRPAKQDETERAGRLTLIVAERLLTETGVDLLQLADDTAQRPEGLEAVLPDQAIRNENPNLSGAVHVIEHSWVKDGRHTTNAFERQERLLNAMLASAEIPWEITFKYKRHPRRREGGGTADTISVAPLLWRTDQTTMDQVLPDGGQGNLGPMITSYSPDQGRFVITAKGIEFLAQVLAQQCLVKQHQPAINQRVHRRFGQSGILLRKLRLGEVGEPEALAKSIQQAYAALPDDPAWSQFRQLLQQCQVRYDPANRKIMLDSAGELP
jgi:hypothetical protein